MDIFMALESAYSSSTENIVITDTSLKLKWKNKDTLPDGFTLEQLRLFQGQGIELPVQRTLTAEYTGGYGASCAVRIEPLTDNGSLVGYLFHIYSCDDIEQLSDRSGYFDFKSNFIGNIRQELSAIVAMLDSHRQKYIDKGDMDYLLFDKEARYRVLRTLSATVNLNELTKYYNGYFPKKILNISDVLGDLCGDAEDLFDDNDCIFTAEIAPAIYYECNSDRLKAAVSNLLINSFMYNSKLTKTCALTLKADEKHFEISVRDNGDGINADRLSALTIPFASFGGYGEHESLGLVVADKFCKAFDAELKIESEENKFTCVKMIFNNPPAEIPKQFRLNHMQPIKSPYDLENCIFAKGLNPLK